MVLIAIIPIGDHLVVYHHLKNMNDEYYGCIYM